ncbi:type IV secretion system protein [Anaerosinus gibii]|uniref:Type IV secretion system protein n=1 Tax=Selenobaculum gibii TaxID=3054208 RepID=A0A9Y2AI56_9FIRM|nr:type IV secretion system protein [Selenobaculum gbiensis]WIW69855.1 type IV secretion system protein [Selenobaculum gbiensis]
MGLLTSLLANFQTICDNGVILLMPHAQSLLILIVTLDFFFSLLLQLEQVEIHTFLITKILKYGTFAFFLESYSTLMNAIMESLIMAGSVAAGGGITIDELTNPSKIIEIGYNLSENVYSFTAAQNPDGSFIGSTIKIIAATLNGELTIAKLFPNLFFFGSSIVLIIGFYIIAWQIFMTLLEFKISAALLPILIPFASFQYTSFIATRAIGMAFAFGVKMMFLTFIISAALPLMQTWTCPENPTNVDCLRLISGVFSVALLAWKAPNMAAGFMGGAPSLTAGSALGAGMAASFATTKISQAASSTARGLANTVRGASNGLRIATAGANDSGSTMQDTGGFTASDNTSSGGGFSSPTDDSNSQVKSNFMGVGSAEKYNNLSGDNHSISEKPSSFIKSDDKKINEGRNGKPNFTSSQDTQNFNSERFLPPTKKE